MSLPAWPPPALREPASGHADLSGGWERLHPLSAVVRAGRGALALLLVILVSSLNRNGNGTEDLIRLGLVIVVLIVGFVSWVVTRWRIAGGVLQIDTGLVRRQSLRYPLTQIQAVDILRPGLARVLGMAELRLRMAGGSGSSGRLAYLSGPAAEQLRARLLAMAHGLDEREPAPPERPLYQVDPRRLVASLLISGPAVIIELAVVAVLVIAVIKPGLAGALLASSATALIGALSAVWQRFNGEYRLMVAEAPDGLRVRAGLVETSSETIPRGRVQALRLVQPVTWRPFGWCRIEVDLAGRATSGRQNRAAKRAGRALVPVGTRAEAEALIGQIMPGGPTERSKPPGRARWKAPLRFAHLSYGLSDRYIVTTSGRLRLVTDWVPLAKVQSIRRSEGPLQRRLGLASVHLDTAGRMIFAVARDRERPEADGLLRTLPDACRAARAAETGIGSGHRTPR
ncbi:PH domain-containing protein [Acidiferrimicrobium sp. IK]|uniref:PH domain-containing protein n=1 Tax=Acidiferrimicrobium sp. IK TaxID=2871700 RepID=UPI0021CB214F|nr:PH domain-containing protein [Acidiferrimicrobium sp. IK]MCU4185297.1 PH domain-containing protein [Acidiferrimicrobium sp. IK]